MLSCVAPPDRRLIAPPDRRLMPASRDDGCDVAAPLAASRDNACELRRWMRCPVLPLGDGSVVQRYPVGAAR